MTPPALPDPVIDDDAVIAPGAQIFGRVRIEARAFILFSTVIRAEFDRIEIGRETNVQDNSVVHCDEGAPCVIGQRVTIGHGAVVHGANVGSRALIGIGALVLNRATIGDGAWLAAGSVLTEGKRVPPWTLAMGIPAKPVRELTHEEVRQADEGVDRYLGLASVYREILS